MANDRLERLREHIDPRWTRAKVERELDALDLRIGARSARRFYLGGAVLLAGTTLALLVATRDGSQSTSAPELARSPAVAPRAEVAPEPAPPPPSDENALAVAEPEPELDAFFDAGTDEPSTRPERGRRARRHHRPRVKTAESRLVVAAQAWQSLAREGRYQEAYLALSRDGLDRQHTAVEELLLAGDAARLSGHAREAVPYYRDALARAGQGPRAHLSAFTLGRTLLHDLHDPRGAAQAFARAYGAAPKGALAEEALAGEVDCWVRLGDRAQARSRAERYLAAFPHGRRASDMERVAKAP